ncbi:MAG: alpha/beta fold hydrolase, partial [Roseimicrobium sp.]
IVVPGWDSVTTDYRLVAERLAREGCAVYGSEARTGVYDPVKDRRGNPENWHDWVADLKAFTQFVRHKHPGLPLFFHGHSFGGVLALQVAAESPEAPPRGVIVHSPGYPFMLESEHTLAMAALRSMAWFRFPHLRWMGRMRRFPTNDAAFNGQWVASEDRLQAGYKVRYLWRAFELGHQARLSSRTLALPVLAFGGGLDRVNAMSDEKREAYRCYLMRELAGGPATAGGHTTAYWYEDGCHTLTAQPTKERLLTAITTWMNETLRPKR